MGNTWLIPKGEEKPQDKYYKKVKKKVNFNNFQTSL